MESRISLQMYTLRDYTKTMTDLDKTLEKLSAIGFRTLQYTVGHGFDKKEVKDLLLRHGMTNDSVFADYRVLKEQSAETLRDCELFETDYIRLASMPPADSASADGYRAFAHYLNENSTELKKAGKKLLYHFHAFEFRRFGKDCGLDIFLRESDPEVIELIPDTHTLDSLRRKRRGAVSGGAQKPLSLRSCQGLSHRAAE